MSIQTQVSKTDLRKIKRSLKDLSAKSQKSVIDSMSTAGLEMQNVSRINTRVDTGRLRRSLRYIPIMEGLGAKLFTNIKYAVFQNNGTARMSGTHFMEKAFNAGVRRLNQSLKRKS